MKHPLLFPLPLLPLLPLPLILFPLLTLTAPIPPIPALGASATTTTTPTPPSTPYKYSFNLFGIYPVTVSISPSSMLAHTSPLLHKTALTLSTYQKPSDPSREPNRLLQHRKNTQAHVDQNGVPWARPPPRGSVDVERVLDERHYARYEELVREGKVVVEVGPGGERRLVWADVWEEEEEEEKEKGEGDDSTQSKPTTPPRRYRHRKPVDPTYGTDMLSLLGKNNGIEKDPVSGKTTFEKYLDGEVNVSQQSIFGKDIPLEYSDDEAVRARYGFGPAPAKKKRLGGGGGGEGGAGERKGKL